MTSQNPNRNDRRAERGSILILGAITLVVVLAFAGLSLDASYMYFSKRNMQTAADAGAYAGALELLRGNSDVTSAAQHDSSLNGFTDGSGGVTVTVNNPPASGSKTGDSNFVEVIVSHPQDTWFMRILNFNSITVKARAVAGVGSTGTGCIYALNSDTSNTNNGFFANGTTNINVSCPVYSNSNFRAVGGSCVVTPGVSYTGTYTNANSDGNCGPSVTTSGVQVVDPVKEKYSIPAYSTCTANNYKVTTGILATIPPGTYCGGISIGGSVTAVQFTGGNYILVNGGLSINGAVNVTGTGVTFFNTYSTNQNKYGPISINGSGTVTLSAPTTGTYKGLLFYQDPSVSWSASNGSIIAGSAASTYDGIIYFPTTDLTYAGTSGTDTSGYTILIGYNVKINGTAQINADYSALGGASPISNVMLAE